MFRLIKIYFMAFAFAFLGCGGGGSDVEMKEVLIAEPKTKYTLYVQFHSGEIKTTSMWQVYSGLDTPLIFSDISEYIESNDLFYADAEGKIRFAFSYYHPQYGQQNLSPIVRGESTGVLSIKNSSPIIISSEDHYQFEIEVGGDQGWPRIESRVILLYTADYMIEHEQTIAYVCVNILTGHINITDVVEFVPDARLICS